MKVNEWIYPRVVKHQLSNGVRVVAQQRDINMVHLSVIFRGGLIDSPGMPPGLAHFVEHLPFLRTKTKGAHELNYLSNRVGSVNAETGAETVRYYFDSLPDKFEEGLSLLAELTQDWVFRKAEVDRELSVIQEEFSEYESAPEAESFRQFLKLAWGGSHFGETEYEVTGLPALNLSEIKRYAASLYSSGRMIIAFSGGIPVEEALALIEQKFGTMRNGSVPGKICPPKLSCGYRAVSSDISSTYYLYGYDAPGRYHRDNILHTVMGDYLAGLWNSPIYFWGRKSGAAYGIRSERYSLVPRSLYYIFGGLKKKFFRELCSVVLEEERKLVSGIVDSTLFEATLEMIEDSVLRELVNLDEEVLDAANSILFTGKYLSYRKWLERLRQVTPAKIIELARAEAKRPRCLVLYGNTGGLRLPREMKERLLCH